MRKSPGKPQRACPAAMHKTFMFLRHAGGMERGHQARNRQEGSSKMNIHLRYSMGVMGQTCKKKWLTTALFGDHICISMCSLAFF